MLKMTLITLAGLLCFGPMLGAGGSCGPKQSAAGSASSGGKNKLATGTWGGDHVRADVSDKGASIEFDCASGAIEEQVFLNDDGKFDLKGKFTPEHGGPVVKDEADAGRPARYVGRVRGKKRLSL